MNQGEFESFLRELLMEAAEDELSADGWPESMKRPLLETQYRARVAGLRHGYPGAEESLILVDGVPAGWLMVARNENEIRLVDIVVARAHRGKGLGTEQLRKLIQESETSGKLLRLSVAEGNRAAALYRRLGFEPTGGDGVRIHLQRIPGRD